MACTKSSHGCRLPLRSTGDISLILSPATLPVYKQNQNKVLSLTIDQGKRGRPCQVWRGLLSARDGASVAPVCRQGFTDPPRLNSLEADLSTGIRLLCTIFKHCKTCECTVQCHSSLSGNKGCYEIRSGQNCDQCHKCHKSL